MSSAALAPPRDMFISNEWAKPHSEIPQRSRTSWVHQTEGTFNRAGYSPTALAGARPQLSSSGEAPSKRLPYSKLDLLWRGADRGRVADGARGRCMRCKR